MTYAAFYADCLHEVKPVQDGCRVCLVYNLVLAAAEKQPRAPQSAKATKNVCAQLDALFEERVSIAIPLTHEYTEAGLAWSALKGQDRGIADLVVQAAADRELEIHLALLSFFQEAEADGEVFEESLTLETRVSPRGEMKSILRPTPG